VAKKKDIKTWMFVLVALVIVVILIKQYPQKSSMALIPLNQSCGNGVCDIASADEWQGNCPSDCTNRSTNGNILAPYHTNEQVYSIMNSLISTHPGLIDSQVIGKTIQGRDIMLYRAGNPNGGVFMFDGRIHGPEDCGTEAGINFITWALTSSEPEAVRVRENNYLIFIPVFNADGYKRQNMRRNYTFANGSILYTPHGIDMNRNFPTGFGGSGVDDPTDDYDYRGLSGGSEPEVTAVSNAMQTYLKNDGHSIYVNVHCGGQYLRYHTSNAASQKVVSLIANISAAKGTRTIELYGSGTACLGGYACTEGDKYSGGNGWLFEITTWSKLPNTLDIYNREWYPQAFPVYLAMAQSVERPSNTTPQPTSYTGYFFFNNTCTQKNISSLTNPYNSTYSQLLTSCTALISTPTYTGYRFENNNCTQVTLTSSFNNSFTQVLNQCQALINPSNTNNFTGYYFNNNACSYGWVNTNQTPYNITFLINESSCNTLITTNTGGGGGGGGSNNTTYAGYSLINNTCEYKKITTNYNSTFSKSFIECEKLIETPKYNSPILLLLASIVIYLFVKNKKK
jgi:hypothetical protein